MQIETKISLKRQDNAYIISNSSGCEVLALSREADENGPRKYFCRVYERAFSLFLNPCDSNLIGAIRAQTRYACIRRLCVEEQ